MNIADVEHYFVLNILIEYTNFIDMFIVGIRDLSSIASQPASQSTSDHEAAAVTRKASTRD